MIKSDTRVETNEVSRIRFSSTEARLQEPDSLFTLVDDVSFAAPFCQLTAYAEGEGRISTATEPNRRYALQGKQDLQKEVWRPLTGWIPGNGERLELPLSLSSTNNLFIRVAIE